MLTIAERRALRTSIARVAAGIADEGRRLRPVEIARAVGCDRKTASQYLADLGLREVRRWPAEKPPAELPKTTGPKVYEGPGPDLLTEQKRVVRASHLAKRLDRPKPTPAEWAADLDPATACRVILNDWRAGRNPILPGRFADGDDGDDGTGERAMGERARGQRRRRATP